MNKFSLKLGLLISILCSTAAAASDPGLITNVRQLTLAGKRSGEAYFNRDGRWMVFQSEREKENPFYQIYLMSLDTGETRRVSPGVGKTTCGWFQATKERILFASTHLDPEAETKMEAEFKFREEGKERRYQFDYDPYFDLFISDFDGNNLQRLTRAHGYDAEGSLSPDDRLLVFASNRHAYSATLSTKDRSRLEIDPSYFLDLYLMEVETGDLQRLTDEVGYDGGPFFSPDGELICWRHFSEDGLTAELWVMNVTTREKHQVTRLGAMSWAPFFHPSGKYLIFTTNLQGFENFELYIVDVHGKSTPQRVTDREGFDGLPTFSFDGKELTWTSNQTPEKKSQMFLGEWDHETAMDLLGLTGSAESPEKLTGTRDPSLDELKRHVKVLAGNKMAGRSTGGEGERLAGEYIASFFEGIGLNPAGSADSYFQEFPFPSAVELGDGNTLSTTVDKEEKTWNIDKDWRPLPFSEDGRFEGEVVFAGYGIVLPEDEELTYNSYVHLDVKDKWVLVLRYAPQEVEADHRLAFKRFSSPRFKAILARERGARGLIFLSGPESKVRRELFDLDEFAPGTPMTVPILSVSDDFGDYLLSRAGKDLGEIHKTLDRGEMIQGFAIPDVVLGAEIDLHAETGEGRNVLGMLKGDSPVKSLVVVGAHYDHLGRGDGGSSLAKENERGQIHHGADDNASGVAVLLEVADFFASDWPADLDVGLLFCAWSGEELGILGSNHFTKNMTKAPELIAYLNMDMVGRLQDKLVVQGVGSSGDWPGLIEQANFKHGLSLTLSPQAYLPTDATSFYKEKVPVLSFFTGVNEEYHTPRDTPEKLNYEGMKQTSDLVISLLSVLLNRDVPPVYAEVAAPKNMGRGKSRVYLGTIPDYAQGEEKGLRLSGVSKDGPADLAGLLEGDVIVKMAGTDVNDIYDYSYVLDSLKVGEEVSVTVLRNGEKVTLRITPASRN